MRESKGLSQGHIQDRTGLPRCYMSRVECGDTTPTIETVEKWANALDFELCQLFYFGKGEPQAPKPAKLDHPGLEQQKLLKVFDRLGQSDRSQLLAMARTLSNHRAH